MSAALQDTTPPLLTYEAYLAEEPTQDRYDILDGVRVPVHTTVQDEVVAQRAVQVLQRFSASLARPELDDAPYVAVEVLSPTNCRSHCMPRLQAHARAGVLEAWLISPEGETVEVMSLSPDSMETRAVYASAHTARSLVFPDLEVPVADLFEDY